MNRRRAPRVPCGLFLHEYNDRGSDDRPEITAYRAANISESGIFLRRLGAGVLLEGEVLNLELKLPGPGKPLWLRGRVVEQVEEARADAAAIELVSLTADDRERLRGYVDRVRRRQLRVALQGLSRLPHALQPQAPRP